mmetsp:Transcript_26086/g.61273  ORF Transcript_26086/g.61273 Transcript_26086/m.61273 type:complete len:98 (-) Transcript_26086:118-411(-)
MEPDTYIIIRPVPDGKLLCICSLFNYERVGRTFSSRWIGFLELPRDVSIEAYYLLEFGAFPTRISFMALIMMMLNRLVVERKCSFIYRYEMCSFLDR